MNGYCKYSETIDSGLEWLGKIPLHWTIEYSKWLFSERNCKATPNEEMLTASQKYGVISQKKFMELEQQKVVQVLKGFGILKQVKNNDFVISMRSFQGGIEYCPFDGAVSSAYVPLIPQISISKSYFKYLFKSKPYIQALQATTNLVRDGQALRYSNFIQVKLPVPSNREAECIGAFLDHETAKIDTLIEKQQQLIKLLKEKRQAVINHAVTKGLNPDAPMIDSGVEWLGEVPVNWDIAVIRRYLLEHRQGYYTTDPYVDDGIKLLRITDLRELGKINVDNCPKVPFSNVLNSFYLEEGDVVFARTGGAGAFGVIPKLHERIVYASYLIRFRFLPKYFNTNYLRFLLIADSFQLAVKSNIHGGVNQNIHAEDIKNTFVAIPSLKEQKETSSYLVKISSHYSLLIQKAESAISLIQERRTALISAAVTGKIDVRNWQPENSKHRKEATV